MTIATLPARALWRHLAAAAGALVGLFGAGAGLAASPPRQEFAFESAALGATKLENEATQNPGGASQAITASFLARHPFARPGWYWSTGVQAENFFFSGNPGLPTHLQDYAAVFSLEYFVGDENAAALTVRPGWYFARRATAAAWDVPLDFTTGVPIAQALDGVIGISNARFYHHALPVFGFVWTPAARVRLEAVYPEPAIILTFDRKTSLRAGGELRGGGFLADTPGSGSRTAVEYVSYRVGAELSRATDCGVKLTVGGGVETERSFDFFRRQPRLHGSGAAFVKFGATLSR